MSLVEHSDEYWNYDLIITILSKRPDHDYELLFFASVYFCHAHLFEIMRHVRTVFRKLIILLYDKVQYGGALVKTKFDKRKDFGTINTNEQFELTHWSMLVVVASLFLYGFVESYLYWTFVSTFLSFKSEKIAFMMKLSDVFRRPSCKIKECFNKIRLWTKYGLCCIIKSISEFLFGHVSW